MFRTFRCHRLMEIASTPCSFSSFPLSSSSCCASSGLFASSVPLLSAPKKSTPVGGPRYNKTTPRASSKKNVHQKSPKQRSQLVSSSLSSKSNASPKSSRKLISHHHHHHHPSNNKANHTATSNKAIKKKRDREQEASAGDQQASGHLKLVREIYEKMSKQWQQSQQIDQSNKNDNNSENTSSTSASSSSSSSPPSCSSCQTNWDRLHEIFTDLEAKLEIDNKPASFDEKKLSRSAISSSAAGGSSAPEKQFCFPRVFLSLGLWAQQQQQQQSPTHSDDDKGVVLPPFDADGLHKILWEECLWLRPDLRDAHGARMFRYWVNASFRDQFIKKTIFPVCDGLNSIKLPFTISEFAKTQTTRVGTSSQQLTEVHSTFTNVLFPSEHPSSVFHSRNIRFGGLVEITKHTLEARRVSIFCGSSGSGKTVGALSAAKHDNSDNVVFFLSAGDECFETLDGETNTDRRNQKTLESLKKKIKGFFSSACVLQEETSTNFNIVIIIDEIGYKPRLLRGLVAMIKQISIDLHNFFFKDKIIASEKEQDTSWQYQTRIRIITAGTGASYLHNAPATTGNYTTFVFDTERETHPTDYNYFRTILDATKFFGENAAKNTAMRSLLMRLDGEHQKELFQRNQEQFESHLSEVQKKRNQPSRSTSPAAAAATPPSQNPSSGENSNSSYARWPTQAEIETGHLLKNARCAALTIQEFIAWIKEYFLPSGVVPSFSEMNERLPSIVYQVVREYAKLNGLQNFKDTPQVLKYALAASLHRLPSLADDMVDDNNNHNTAKPKTNEVVDFEVANASWSLITIGGVLLDVCQSTTSNKDKISLKPFLPSSSSSQAQPDLSLSENEKTSSEKETPCVTRDHNFCRYFLSPPHLVMLRSFAGMPLARPLDFSYSFEQGVAEFCGLTAMCSNAIWNLEMSIKPKLLDNEKVDLLEKYNNQVNEQHDTLFKLKKLLSFGPKIDGVEILQLIDSPLRNITRLRYPVYAGENEAKRKQAQKNRDDVLDNARAKMKLLKDKISSALKVGQAVVILSREMEPFADVIVVGPGRVLLIQCKQKYQEVDEYLSTEEDSAVTKKLSTEGTFAKKDLSTQRTVVRDFAKVGVSEELFKMGVLDFDAETEFFPKKFHDDEKKKEKKKMFHFLGAYDSKIRTKTLTSKAMHDLRVDYLECLKKAAVIEEPEEEQSDARHHLVEKVGENLNERAEKAPPEVIAVFMMELGSSLDSANKAITERDFLSQQQSPVPYLASGVKVQTFSVSRPGHDSNRLAASPFFPVPFTCEAVTDNGKYLTVAEAKRGDKKI